MNEIQSNLEEFRKDKIVEQQFKDINESRLHTSKLFKQIKKDPQTSSHYLKRQVDPRVKYDTEFINVQKKLGTKFEGEAKKFISHMKYLREQCKKNFDLKKDRIAEINKDRMTDAERKNKEIYERIVRVKKEFREFLDKRQDYLEKKKKMVLGKKNWN